MRINYKKHMTKNIEKKELLSFSEWQETVSFSDYVSFLKHAAYGCLKYEASATIKKIKGEILASIVVFDGSGFSYKEKLVKKRSLNAFISDSLDNLEEILLQGGFGISSIDLTFGEEAEMDFKFNVPEFFNAIYKCEMLVSGYTEEEIEEVNKVDF